MSGAVAVLGQAGLLPGPAVALRSDPELGRELEELEGFTGDLHGRTLSGQLAARPQGMSRWPRLDRYGHALARVCDAALRREPPGPGAPCGLYVSSLRSCGETNAAFDRGLVQKGPRLASPMLFPYTLPGSAASEIAMLFGLGGPYLVFPGGPRAALGSLVAAADAIEDGEAQRLLVASADVLGGATLRWLLETGQLADNRPPVAEGAAALWLARPEDAGAGPRRGIEAALGPCWRDAGDCERLMREALERAGVGPGSLAEVISTSVTAAHHEIESAALERLAPGLPLLRLGWTTGDAGASLGLLAVLAALESDEPRLLLAADPGGALALVLF